MTHRFAVGHYVGEKEAVVARPWPIPRAANPAGGITTSINNLLRYARFHVGDGLALDGARLLSGEHMRLMHTPQVSAGGMAEFVGLTWLLRTWDGVRVMEHDGGTNSQTTTLKLVPERNFAVMVLTNADRGGTLCMHVTNWGF